MNPSNTPEKDLAPAYQKPPKDDPHFSPAAAYRNMVEFVYMEFSKAELLFHPSWGWPILSMLRRMKRIARDWQETRIWCNIHDAAVIEGDRRSFSAHKGDTEERLRRIENAFWS